MGRTGPAGCVGSSASQWIAPCSAGVPPSECNSKRRSMDVRMLPVYVTASTANQPVSVLLPRPSPYQSRPPFTGLWNG